MRKDYLAIKMFVMFGYNYSSPKEFITYICEKTQKSYLIDHLTEKFSYIYDKFGSHAVMNRFFVELDSEMQEALVEYAINVYAPQGMSRAYAEYAQP